MNYAGFWRRFFAMFIDNIILALFSAIFSALSFDLIFTIGIGFILQFIYFPFFDSSVMQATPGKALLGMVVVGETTGARINFKTAIIRFFDRYLSAIVLYIGYIMQVFTTRRQCLHDMIAETVVIRQVTPEDVNFFRAWKNQVHEVVNRL